MQQKLYKIGKKRVICPKNSGVFHKKLFPDILFAGFAIFGCLKHFYRGVNVLGHIKSLNPQVVMFRKDRLKYDYRYITLSSITYSTSFFLATRYKNGVSIIAIIIFSK